MYENESDSDVSGLGNDASVPGVTANDILRDLNLEVPSLDPREVPALTRESTSSYSLPDPGVHEFAQLHVFDIGIR